MKTQKIHPEILQNLLNHCVFPPDLRKKMELINRGEFWTGFPHILVLFRIITIAWCIIGGEVSLPLIGFFVLVTLALGFYSLKNHLHWREICRHYDLFFKTFRDQLRKDLGVEINTESIVEISFDAIVKGVNAQLHEEADTIISYGCTPRGSRLNPVLVNRLSRQIRIAQSCIGLKTSFDCSDEFIDHAYRQPR